MKRTGLLAVLLGVWSLSAAANTDPDLLRQANQRYNAGDFAAAIEGYDQLLRQGYSDAIIYYNLGNAHFRNGNLGQARWHYEKALRLAPGDPDVLYNLKLLSDALPYRFEELPTIPPVAWWRALRDQQRACQWAFWCVLACWMGTVAWGLWKFSGSRPHLKKIARLVGFSATPLALILFVLTTSRYRFEMDHRVAIVMESEVTLRTAPDDAGTDIMQLHPGTKVELTDSIGAYYKVELPNGEPGWLLKTALRTL